MKEIIVPVRIQKKVDRLMKLNKSKRKLEKDVCDWLKRKGFPTEDEEFEGDVVETLKSAGFQSSREFVQNLNKWNKPSKKNN